jgi:hypothetical protein
MYMHTVVPETEPHMTTQLALLESMAANASKDPVAFRSIKADIAWLKESAKRAVVNPQQAALNAANLDKIKASLVKPKAPATARPIYANRLMGLPQL